MPYQTDLSMELLTNGTKITNYSIENRKMIGDWDLATKTQQPKIDLTI